MIDPDAGDEYIFDQAFIDALVPRLNAFRDLVKDIPDAEIERWWRLMNLFAGDDEAAAAPYARPDATMELALWVINAEETRQRRREESDAGD